MKSRKIPIRRYDIFLCAKNFRAAGTRFIEPAIVTDSFAEYSEAWCRLNHPLPTIDIDCGDDCGCDETDSAMQKKLTNPPTPVLHPGQEWEEENLKLPWWE